METWHLPKQWLEREYTQRRAKNPAYSLRAFAKTLGIPSGRLSQLLSGKRSLTPKLGSHIAERLGYDPKKTERFLATIGRSRKAKRRPGIQKIIATQLTQDQFQSIADPIHYELLSLLETDDCKTDIAWMAQRLDHSVIEVRAAVERLQRLGLVTSELKLAGAGAISVDTKVRSSAIRRAHKQVLEHAAQSIEAVDPLLREIASMTLAIELEKIPQAKEMITEFRRRLSDFLESGPKNEVYRFNIQLVPVTKIPQIPGETL